MIKLQNKLKQLKEQARLRSLNLPAGIDLTSNDYLGMRNHPALKKTALEAIESGLELGAGGSRLLRGHSKEFVDLEDYATSHFGHDKALYFANGFIANYALFTTLPDRHDTIIYDSLIHASARDGIAASHAKGIKFDHNDLNHLGKILEKARKQTKNQIWVAVESLYSMDGDIAPLNDIQKLCQKYDAILIVDEAHATGVFGSHGKGLSDSLEKVNLIELHTCGKAVGVAGGLLCASADIIDYMINAARPFIYSTAPPPLQALLTHKSLEILASAEGDQRRKALQDILDFVRSSSFLGGAYKNTPSHIVPIILGEDALALEVADHLQTGGFDIRAIRPPTVAEGTARLRLALSTNLDTDTLKDFSDMLSPLLRDQAA